MKVTCVSEEKSLELCKNYKVKQVRKVENSFFYKVQLSNGDYKWVDSKKFKYPMKWLSE